LAAPETAQRDWLQRQLTRDAGSVFGRSHDFATVRDYRDFAARVPVCRYVDVAPYVSRIQGGESDVLTCSPVTHLVPTSGSSGARKLIPFTSELQRSFDAAVAPWMIDLARLRPSMRGGPAYWSISPLSDAAHDEDAASAHGASTDAGSAVPIGFADDADYLGGAKAWLIRQVLAVPSSVRHVHDESTFWALTLLALLRRRDLRVISIWHPSFLELLVGQASVHWSALLDAVASGDTPGLAALPAAARVEWRSRPDRTRAEELRRIGAEDWPRWWPALQVVSCWGEQAAASGWRRLAARLPQCLVQPKGLLATEAVVTVPVRDTFPLAITSHFFEFRALMTGEIVRAHDVERGAQYEVIVTNGAGLWRYNLGDVVECTGFLHATPSLRFLGRIDNVSDLRGEKLSEPFVAECLRALWPDGGAPTVAVLRAVDEDTVGRYELLLSADGPADSVDSLAARLERALHANPHYALARRLGQLAAVRIVTVPPEFAQQAVRHEAQSRAGRLGDVKPRTLIRAGA
jgi:hypothetical protein